MVNFKQTNMSVIKINQLWYFPEWFLCACMSVNDRMFGFFFFLLLNSQDWFECENWSTLECKLIPIYTNKVA